MKNYSNANFAVSVREEGLEHEPELASLFEGTFSVHCNHLVAIRFVPAFRTTDNRPPTAAFADSFDWDAPPDAIAARWKTAVSSGIVVSPDDTDALETFDSPWDEQHGHLVTLNTSDFEAISREVRELLEARPEVAWRAFGGGGIPVAELESTLLVRFLRSHLLNGAILDSYPLKMLGAE